MQPERTTVAVNHETAPSIAPNSSDASMPMGGRPIEIPALAARGGQPSIDGNMLEYLAATSHDIFYIFDLRGRALAYINNRVRAVLGYEASELENCGGSPFRALVHPADVPILEEHYRNVSKLGDKEILSVEYRVRRADGHYAWLRCSDAVFHRSPSGAVERIVGSAIDVTDNRHLLEDLRRISRRLLETQNEERRRIARELHDSTAQQLVALSVGLARIDQLVRRAVPKGSRAELTGVVQEMRSIARDAQREIRTLSYLLHPPVLESMGLADALRRYLAGFTRRTRIHTRLVVDDTFSCGSHSISTALMRIAQEALINVFRHAKATDVRISLANRNRQTILEVHDNGRGLPMKDDVPDEDRIEAMGVGIPGMRARVRQFRGELEIVSGKSGTQLRAAIPDRAGSLLDTKL